MDTTIERTATISNLRWEPDTGYLKGIITISAYESEELIAYANPTANFGFRGYIVGNYTPLSAADIPSLRIAIEDRLQLLLTPRPAGA